MCTQIDAKKDLETWWACNEDKKNVKRNKMRQLNVHFRYTIIDYYYQQKT